MKPYPRPGQVVECTTAECPDQTPSDRSASVGGFIGVCVNLNGDQGFAPEPICRGCRLVIPGTRKCWKTEMRNCGLNKRMHFSFLDHSLKEDYAILTIQGVQYLSNAYIATLEAHGVEIFGRSQRDGHHRYKHRFFIYVFVRCHSLNISIMPDLKFALKRHNDQLLSGRD